MKRFTRDEILGYAKRRVQNAQQQRFILPVFSILILVALGLLIKMLHEKSDALQTTLIADGKFLAGFAFAIMFILFAAVGGFGLAYLLSRFKGIEYQAFKRLIELEDKETGQQNAADILGKGRAPCQDAER